MNNYNDFPTLTNEQYEDLNTAYNNQPTTDINQATTRLEFCINSLTFIFPSLNKSLQEEITSSCNQLKSIKDSLKLLYPNINFNSNKHSNNLFTILQELTTVSLLLNKIIDQSKKAYYIKVLHRLNLEVLNVLSNFMKTLSCLEIKFFKFM